MRTITSYYYYCSSSCAARPSPSGNDPSLNTGPSPSMESSSSSISRPLLSNGCSVPNPALSMPVIEPCEMRKLISDTFDFVDDISCARHSYFHCLEQNCQSVSNLDASLLHGKKDKFQHKWLSDKELTYCYKTGFFWLLYAEGKGMYCILRSKHKTRNKQNQADIFTGKPGTRYKKSALQSHADSDRHKAAIEAELLQKNSQFARELSDKPAKGDKTMFSAFMSAYWLAKHEVANSKLLSLLKLLETSGVEHMKYFSCKVRKHFVIFF